MDNSYQDICGPATQFIFGLLHDHDLTTGGLSVTEQFYSNTSSAITARRKMVAQLKEAKQGVVIIRHNSPKNCHYLFSGLSQ